MTSPSRGYDDLTDPGDYCGTITREAWLRAQAEDEEHEARRVVVVEGYRGSKLA